MDYAAAQALYRKHKGLLTRAKKKGPKAVLLAVDAFYEDFERVDFPLPDSWHTWDIARYDALTQLRLER